MRKIAITAAVGAAAWYCILLLDYGLNAYFVQDHVRGLWTYVTAGGGLPRLHDLSVRQWLLDRVTVSSPWIVGIYLTTPLALLAVAFSRTRDELALSGSFLLASLGWTAFLYKRDYPTTMLEAAFAVHLFLYVTVTVILEPRLAAIRRGIPVAIGGAVLAAGFAAMIVRGTTSPVLPILSSAAINTTDQAALTAVQQAIPGRHLWIVLDNTLRPLSIESAIMKGGLIPGSRIMPMISPDTDFRFTPRGAPFQLADYSAVFFPFDGSVETAVHLLSREYAVPLNEWRCRRVIAVGVQPIAVCQP